jgi:hypothetical protein
MKNTLIAFAASLLLAFNSSPAQEANVNGSALVLVFSDYSEQLNMDLHVAFKNDPSMRIVNSCDALNMVVFQTKEGQAMNKVQAKSYLQVRFKDVLQRESDSYQIREDVSPSEVLMLCREKMQTIYGVEAK